MTMINHPSSTPSFLVPGEGPGTDGFSDRNDWQRVWLRTQSLDWRTLVLVPGDDQTSTLDVATLIARLALEHGASLRIADVRTLRPKHVDTFLDGVRWEVSRGTRIVLAASSPSNNLATVRIARAADCTILCASLGTSSLKSIQCTVEEIGQEHFLGSLLVLPPGKAAPLRPVRAVVRS